MRNREMDRERYREKYIYILMGLCVCRSTVNIKRFPLNIYVYKREPRLRETNQHNQHKRNGITQQKQYHIHMHAHI